MTAHGWDEDPTRTAPANRDQVAELITRAVIVPALPRAVVGTWADALGVPGWVVPDSAAPGHAFYVGGPEDALAVAAACSAERSSPPAVVLWLDGPGARPDGERAGVVAVHRRSVLTGHQWPDEDDSQVGDAARLAELVGRPDAEVGLRALLRRRDRPAAVLLHDLVALAELPGQALALLTAPARPHDAEVLAPGPPRGVLATVRAASRTLPEPGWSTTARRWQWLLPAAVSVYFVVRAVLAAVAGFGAPGDGVGYGVLAAIAACSAGFWRWRGARRPG